MKAYYYSLPLVFFSVLCTSCTKDDAMDEEEEQEETTAQNYSLSLAATATNISEEGGVATLTISLDKENEDADIAVTLSGSGAAIEDVDYELVSTSETIASGEQEVLVNVRALDDEEEETDETFTVKVATTAENITIANSEVTITILDNDEEEEGACAGTEDTYAIDLDETGCTVDIETTLGITSMYEESVTGTMRTIRSNAIPNHHVGEFPNNGNPHSITAQDVSYTVTTSPSKNSSITTLTTENGNPRYRFGILYNGIVLAPIAAEFFTNTSNGEDNTDWNENALSSEIRLGTDCNNSHVFPSGMYHHHATPTAYIASLDIGGTEPVQIGWAADGYPIYYKYGNKEGAVVALTSSYRLKTEERGGDGISAPSGCPDGTYTQDYEYNAGQGDLDECNGYDDPQLGYIYVITDTYPSIPRCFVGTPNETFTN